MMICLRKHITSIVKAELYCVVEIKKFKALSCLCVHIADEYLQNREFGTENRLKESQKIRNSKAKLVL